MKRSTVEALAPWLTTVALFAVWQLGVMVFQICLLYTSDAADE